MIAKIFSSSEPEKEHATAPGVQVDDQGGSQGIESLAEGEVSRDQGSGSAAPKDRTYLETLYPDDWSKRFECMGELIVERKADPSEVVQVYKTLNEGLEADIFYVNPTAQGMSIVCGIKDLGSFIDSLPKMPRLASWALIHA